MANPSQLLKRLSAEYPRAWASAENMCRQRGRELPDWPKWCFLPAAGWYAILSCHFGHGRLDVEQVADLGALAAVGAWRYSKGVYRFAPEIFEAVYAAPPRGDIPADVLKRLPEWCVYIETPLGLMGRYTWHGLDVSGFFVHLESDANSGREELRLLILTPSGLHYPSIVCMGEHTIADGVMMAADHAIHAIGIMRQNGLPGIPDAQALVEQQMRDTFGLVSLALYLCSDGADIAAPGTPGKKSAHAKLKKSRRSLEEAPRVTFYQVGEGLARQIREAEKTERGPVGERSAPRPHLRRGHWHHYWTGPRTPQEGATAPPERRLSVKWIHPLMGGARE